MTEISSRPTRRGRSARRQARAKPKPQIAVSYIKRQIPLTEFLSEESLTIIEANSDTLLEEIGIDFRDDAEVAKIL